MKLSRRIFSALLALAMLLPLLPSIPQKAEAATYYTTEQITQKLNSWKSKLNGKYWNYYNRSEWDSKRSEVESKLKAAVDNGVLNKSNPTNAELGVTTSACSGDVFAEGCRSNYFSGGWQCFGFGWWLEYALFGSTYQFNSSDWNVYSGSSLNSISLQPGDYVRVNNHSIVVSDVSGGKLNCVEAWGGSGCKISWSPGFNWDQYTTASSMLNAVKNNGGTVYRYKYVGAAHAETPSITWWFSDTEYGDSVANLVTGNSYYFCYRLYDSLTGKDWDEVSSDDYSVSVSIYYPDGSLAYGYTDYDDTGWVRIYYESPGTYTKEIIMDGDYIYDMRQSFYVAPYGYELRIGSLFNTSISNGGEMDYYHFTPAVSGEYVIYSRGSDDTRVYLYNANGTELASDDDSGENNNFRLVYYLTAGTTYVFGVKFYDSSKTGYLSFTLEWACDGELNVDTSHTAAISSGGDMQYFSYTPTQSGTYVIYSTGTDDTQVYLYDENVNQLGFNDDDGDGYNFRLEYELTAYTTYIFGIKYYNSGKTGTIPFNFGKVYTLSYNANGGSGAPSAQNYDYGTDPIVPSTVPTRSGYTFCGWGYGTSSTKADLLPGDTWDIGDLNWTLYAVWRENISASNSATISTGGEMKYYAYTPSTSGNYVIYSTGSNDTKVFLYDLYGTQLASNDDGGDGTNFRLEYYLTAGTTYVFGVKFYDSTTGTINFNFGKTYSVSYNANGGSGAPSSQTKDHGVSLTLSSTVPTKTGYTFQGWATSSTATSASYQPGGSFSSNANTTLYAVWKANTYTVSYNANGGSGAPSSQTKDHGVSLTLSSTVPTKTGYTFQGWATSSTATSAGYQPGGSFSSNANTTLYAVWKANTYTVSYNANGGSGAPSSQTKTHGVSLTLSSTTPTRTGYTFQGWATSSTATSASYQPGGSFTTNATTTLYAVWKANTYTVSYSANGGSGAPSSQTKTYGVSLTLSSTTPTRTGYIFRGWATSSTATSATYQPGATFSTNGNITLYAVWEAATVTGITIKTQPTKTEYWIGESLDTTGLTLTATYSDGSSKTVSSGFTTTGFNSTSAGSKTVTVTYEGKTATFTVTIKQPTVTGITVKTQPSKTEYWLGESLDTAGLTLTATYSDGSSKTVSNGFTTSGFSSTAAGNKTVTVSYEGKTATFTVTIKQPTVTGITIKTQPTKTEYWIGESLDTTGLTLTATYSDGSSETISSGFKTSGFNSASVGTKIVIVTFESKDASFAVVVKQADIGCTLGHSFTQYISNEDATCLADGTKTAKCDRCNETDTLPDDGSKLGHSFTKYVSNNDATCLNDGTEMAKCDRCTKTDIRTVDDSALGHSFTTYVSNDDATCEDDGTEKAKCDHCTKTDTRVIEGSALGHSFTKYVSNGDATCEDDGTEKAKCDRCTKTDTHVDEGSALGHSFTKYISNNDATYDADGTKTAKCDRCEETETSADVGSKLIRNGWFEIEKKWYFFENDTTVKNTWKKDSKGWVYLGGDGAMLSNAWVRDSVGWCYVGADGYAVTNCWKQDSVGWCYLNSEGSMTKNAWVQTDGKWYWLDSNGYRATNKWMKDSKGWVWLGADGAMVTNKWVTDSKGWCYVGADGYAVTNCWKKDSIGWCYLDKEGSMTKNAWVETDSKWYYLDGNGYMISSCWRKIGSYEYYFHADGHMAANERIQGYWIDGNGHYIPGK